MRITSRHGAWALVLALALLGCAKPPVVSDTGYSGTWERGTEIVKSRLAIVELGGAYHVRWTRLSADGKWKTVCDWEGRCEEFVDGEKTSDYTFKTWIDGDTKLLRVECTGFVQKPNEAHFHWIDELVVKDEGHSLLARTLEEQGKVYEGRGPKRRFKKISNDVEDPPPGWSPPRG